MLLFGDFLQRRQMTKVTNALRVSFLTLFLSLSIYIWICTHTYIYIYTVCTYIYTWRERGREGYTIKVCIGKHFLSGGEGVCHRHGSGGRVAQGVWMCRDFGPRALQSSTASEMGDTRCGPRKRNRLPLSGFQPHWRLFGGQSCAKIVHNYSIH